MKSIITLLLGISYALGSDIRQWDLMPEDTNSTNGGNELGICFGSSTSWSSYPYTVALRYTSGGACCSGSILSLNPGRIMTAAHCNGCTGAVRVGCNNPNNCDGDQYAFTPNNFVQHPNYGSGLQFSSDIAVINLNGPITTSGATAVQISAQEPTQGSVRTVGYGVTQSGSIPTSLQTAQLNIIERSQCDQIMSSALGGGTYIDNTMVCIRGGNAGQENVPSTCSGDSGGPSHFGNNQYGVTSWGLQGSGAGCNSCSCCVGYPGVLANTAHFAGWLQGYVDDWDAAYARDQNLTKALRMKKAMQ